MRRRDGLTTAVLLGVLALVAVAQPSAAGASPVVLGSVVSADPANYTPRVTAGVTSKVAVYKMTQVGSTIFAGGEFTQVQNASRTATYARQNLFSFDTGTGAVTSLSVRLDGAVWAIASDGASLYVGGTFGTVNGVARRGLVKLNPVTGAVDTNFNARLNGSVREAELVGGRLIIGGEFTKRLQAVSPATGTDTGYINVSVAGDVDGAGGWAPRVYRFAVSPTGTRLVAVGNFLTVAGEVRARAFMLDLGTGSATLSSWYYQPLTRECAASSLKDYLKDVDFAPDGSWFVIAASGFVPRLTSEVGTSVCDAAARFETGVPSPTRPTWINYTGGDTLQATTVTSSAVYVQGHNRWLDNPLGRDSCGAGCVSRPGIGAINPTTGKALAWNPTKDRGEGGKDLLLTAAGLWVGSDTTVIGQETRERLALLPAQ